MENKFIETYLTNIDDKGNAINGLYFLIVELPTLNQDGSLGSYIISNVNRSDFESLSFIIDENIKEQLEYLKIQYIDNRPRLVPIEGYEFKYPSENTETDTDAQIKELEAQLALLKNKKGNI
ncbi:hypothetical protein QOK74_08545 [Staphylococcus saprophyticus]|uniref:hypothetical protein n=1 Tax=Staphylococcus saprophyticus TaxID=29385 RepID=UPI0024C38577|nr:hypothetical protein [Staphylococcus saprophyticus]MDK1672921.1 hypothetical protein [Staphylococcus saprophyticus]